MRKALRLVVALAWTTFGCAADDAPAGRETLDAGDLAEAGSMYPADAGSMYEGLSCEQLVTEVWKLPRECDENTPCTLVGTSCTPSWLFIAVSYSGWQRATDLHDAMRKSRCSLGWDGWIPRAACVRGICETIDTERNCMPTGNPGWDAGDPERSDGGAPEGGTSDGSATAAGAAPDAALVSDDGAMRDL